jgi:hypothetical protein
MTDDPEPVTPPQNSGPPDPVERDGAALSSAEDLDEEGLAQDPLEGGMEPPDEPTGVDLYGTTAEEQRTPQPLGERLDEERPDVG